MKIKWGNIIIIAAPLSYLWIIPECIKTGIFNGLVLLPIVIIMAVAFFRCTFDYPDFDSWEIGDITDGKHR